MLIKYGFWSTNFLSCILFFYLSEVSLLFDDVFLLQAKKIELWKIEKREQPHLLQQSSETKDTTGDPLIFCVGRNVTGKDLDKWSSDSYEIWFLLSRSCDLFNCANVRITYSNSRSQTRRWFECHSSLTSHLIEFLVCKSAP